MAIPRVKLGFNSIHRRDDEVVRRRHATFFPSSLDLATQFKAQAARREDIDDDESMWMFRAPVEPFINRRLKRNTDTELVLSPAQEIARRFRAGLKLDLDTDRSSSTLCSSPSSSPSPSSPSTLIETDDSHWDDSDSNEWSVPTSPVIEPVLKHRPSRAVAVARHREEAVEEMHRFGLREDSPMVCPRRYCRDTLANVDALAYHLHLHDIHLEKMHECKKCGDTFNTRRAVFFHACPTRSKSAPTSPILATFQHVLSKITSLN